MPTTNQNTGNICLFSLPISFNYKGIYELSFLSGGLDLNETNDFPHYVDHNINIYCESLSPGIFRTSAVGFFCVLQVNPSDSSNSKKCHLKIQAESKFDGNKYSKEMIADILYHKGELTDVQRIDFHDNYRSEDIPLTEIHKNNVEIKVEAPNLIDVEKDFTNDKITVRIPDHIKDDFESRLILTSKNNKRKNIILISFSKEGKGLFSGLDIYDLILLILSLIIIFFLVLCCVGGNQKTNREPNFNIRGPRRYDSIIDNNYS